MNISNAGHKPFNPGYAKTLDFKEPQDYKPKMGDFNTLQFSDDLPPVLRDNGRGRFYEVTANPAHPTWRQEIAKTGIAFNEIARDGEEAEIICESLSEAVQSGISGSTGQFFAKETLEAASKSKYPETRSEVLSEGIESIIRHPYAGSQIRAVAEFANDSALKSNDTEETAMINQATLERIKASNHEQEAGEIIDKIRSDIQDIRDVQEIKDFLTENNESQEEQQMSLPVETDETVLIGETLVSKRKSGPPPPEFG
jgi:hypothetical protein